MSAYKSVPDLLPCPFCGNTELSEERVSNTGGNVRFIWCHTCSAQGPWFDRNALPPPQFQWNRRAAPRAPDTDLVERLRAAGPNSGYMLIMTEAANHIAAQAAEIESLRAQCGLRQIQGYKEGRAKAEDEIARLQSSLDRLTGMKFSDRIHAALVSRAEKAEAEIARLRISEAAIRESWQTLNAENARLIKELIDGKDEIARFKADLRQETEIVDRIWAIFGTPTYEELKGRSIYDLVSQAKADAESNRRAHARYEHVRRLNVRQFADLFERNLHGEGAFDDLVDAALGNAEGESREH